MAILRKSRKVQDLRDTLGNTIKTLAARAQGKGLEMVCHVLSDVPNCLVGDPARFPADSD